MVVRWVFKLKKKNWLENIIFESSSKCETLTWWQDQRREILTNEFSGKKTTLVQGEWESSMGVILVRGSLSTCALKDSCIGDHVGEIWPWLLEKCLELVSRKEYSMWVDFGWLWNPVGMICGWWYGIFFLCCKQCKQALYLNQILALISLSFISSSLFSYLFFTSSSLHSYFSLFK